jgi:hypothetical protein
LEVWGIKMALKILFHSNSLFYNPVKVDGRVVLLPQVEQAAVVVEVLWLKS